MAKKTSKASSNGKHEEASAAYFKSLTMENVKCFKGEHTIDLSNKKSGYAHWTVILGNNNTGKTTILKSIASLESIPLVFADVPTDKQKPAWIPSYMSHMIIDSFNKTNKLLKSTQINSELLLKFQEKDMFGIIEKWGAVGNAITRILYNPHLQIETYGVVRKISSNGLSEIKETNRHQNLFGNEELMNVEEWILQLFLSEKLGEHKAKTLLKQIRSILTSGLLPDVKDFNIVSEKKGATFNNFVLFDTDFGKIRLRDLGYGYQTMMAWVLDLVRRMVERYPESENPLAEPAIVLVDEIDLHLHPEWQRKIIGHLSKYFPNTQFIVTAHSPLIVQSAENVNLVLLRKENDQVTIEQPKIRNFKGWTVEEILSDLMNLEGQTMSDTYLTLVEKFTQAIENDDFRQAQEAYKGLDEILHPRSERRKLFRLEMTSLTHA
jgi:predicted ATP-binding protein involved in virulence